MLGETLIFFNWLRVYKHSLKCQHGCNRISIWGKVGWLDIQDLSCCVPIYFPIVMYRDGVCCCLHVSYIVYNTGVDNGSHQCLGVCEVSHTYLLGCLRYLEKQIYCFISCGYLFFCVAYKHVIEM